MCSVDPDELTEMTRATEGLDISRGDVVCRKCGTSKAEVVLRVKDAYCRLCFLLYFVHKFRSTIGKSKQIHAGDRVLVATSGGASSTALLHLLREGLNENSHKRLRFEPTFLYVDESCVSSSPRMGPEYVQKICSEVNSLDFPIYVTSLQQVMVPKPHPPVLFTKEWKDINFPTTSGFEENLCKLLCSCRSTTAQEDLLEQLRREIIVHSAQTLGYQKVFLADNSSKLSIRILSQVAMGRGSQLSSQVNFKAFHHDIEVYRPMREILENEILYYVDLHGLTVLQAPTFEPKGTSITSCAKEFVLGLQKDFPATIPTVFRTGDKLVSTYPDCGKSSSTSLNGDPDSDFTVGISSNRCALCGSHLDTGQGEASALHATLVSQKLSCHSSSHMLQQTETNNGTIVSHESYNMNGCATEKTSDSCDCDQSSGCCGGGKISSIGNRKPEIIDKDVMERYLCYGCRIILREMEEVHHLPIKVQRAAAGLEQRRRMREQIQDFLL